MKTLVLILLTLAPVGLRAQPVAIYDFTNNSSIPTTFAGVTGTAFGKSPQLINAVPNNNLLSVSPDDDATSPALAVLTQQYVEFTLTPPPGRKLHFEAITFEAAKQAPNGTGRGWVLRASRDNFASDLGTQEIIGPAPAFTDFRVDLPRATFFNVGQPVTFRLYTYAPAALLFVDYDNFQVLATVDKAPTVDVDGALRRTQRRPRVSLRGTASDDTRVERVTVNGRPARGTDAWSATVPLRRGLNRLTVVAVDEGGTSSAPRTVLVRFRPGRPGAR